MRYLSCLTPVAFVLLALCSCNTTDKKAGILYQKADSLFQARQYHLAKLNLDSITESYANNIEFTTRAKDLLFKIKTTEQQNNLHYLDSIIALKQASLSPLLQNFEKVDDGNKRLLVHKRQKNINYYGRTYLRPILDTLGNFHIASYYCGGGYIHHQQLKVTSGNESALSEVVESDGFNNRTFDDGSLFWEIVQYKDGKDNGIIDFIAQHSDKPLKVQYIGKRNAVTFLETADKESIRDGYEISFLLKEIATLQKEKENAHKELKRLGAQQNDR